jgi:hypothetical protein
MIDDRTVGNTLSDVLTQASAYQAVPAARQLFADGEAGVDVHTYQFQVNLAADALLRAAEIRAKEEADAQASP